MSELIYVVTIRGPLPKDIRRKLSAAHAEAIKAAQREKNEIKQSDIGGRGCMIKERNQ